MDYKATKIYPEAQVKLFIVDIGIGLWYIHQRYRDMRNAVCKQKI